MVVEGLVAAAEAAVAEEAGVAEDGKITEAEAAEAAVEDVVEADDPEKHGRSLRLVSHRPTGSDAKPATV